MKYKMIPNPATTWKCTDRATASKTSSFLHGTGVIYHNLHKDHPSYGKRHRCTKIRRSRLCGWPSMLCAERRDETSSRKMTTASAFLSFLSSHEWAATFHPRDVGGYYTHLKSEGQLERCTVSRRTMKTGGDQSFEGKTKHTANLGY
jgi:hypothetical protein